LGSQSSQKKEYFWRLLLSAKWTSHSGFQVAMTFLSREWSILYKIKFLLIWRAGPSMKAKKSRKLSVSSKNFCSIPNRYNQKQKTQLLKIIEKALLRHHRIKTKKKKKRGWLSLSKYRHQKRFRIWNQHFTKWFFALKLNAWSIQNYQLVWR